MSVRKKSVVELNGGREAVGGRKITVKRISGAPAPQTCHILFVGSAGESALPALTGLGQGVLTVGEGDGFLSQGGMISFIIDNRRVRFDIDLRAALRATLRLSSKLLSVARKVEK